MPESALASSSKIKRQGKSVLTTLLGLIVLAAVAWFVYGRTLHYDLIYDDYVAITTNESIKKLFPLFGEPGEDGPLRPTRYSPLEVRPLVNLTLALNYHFSELDPAGYRLWNIIGHFVVSAILWWIVVLTLYQPVFQDKFAALGKSLGLGAAMIWMIHPVHQDTVVYITQRTELQMGLFYALTILAAIGFWKVKSRWLKLLIALAATCLSVCGMLSKEMMASVPSMVAAYEWTFIGGSLGVILRRSWMLYLGLILSWVPIAAIYYTGGGTPAAGFNNTISAYDFWLTQSNTFFNYWRLTFYPFPLLIHYYVPTLTSMAEAWPGVLGLAVYGLATIYLFWRRSVFGFGFLWFFAILSPTLIVPLPNEEMAERRLYVTLMAVIPIFVTVLAVGLLRISKSWSDLPIRSKILAWIPMIAITLGLGAVSISTVHRLEKSSEIWDYVVKYHPEDFIALAFQGTEECNQGDVDTGLPKILAAYQKNPKSFISDALIKTLDFIRDYPRLLAICRQQYELFPGQPRKVYMLAVAYEKNGMAAEAIQKYRETIDLYHDTWEAHGALATLLVEAGQVEEAIKHFEISVRLHEDCVNCTNLFMLYLDTFQAEKAMKIAPKLLRATRKEKSAAEAEQLERELKRLEAQLQSQGKLKQPSASE